MTELRCPSCGGALELDEQHPDMETCLQCHAKYQICWERSAETGKEEVCLKPLPKKIAYEPVREVEKKKSGWEPWGWKRGVALVILFFVLMGIMYGPKIYRRYQMDHGGGTGTAVEGTAEAKGTVVEGTTEAKGTVVEGMAESKGAAVEGAAEVGSAAVAGAAETKDAAAKTVRA